MERGIDREVAHLLIKAVITVPQKWGHLMIVSDTRNRLTFFRDIFLGRNDLPFPQCVIPKQCDCEISHKESKGHT